MKPKKAKKLIICLWIIGMTVLLFSYVNNVFLPIGIIIAASSLIPNILVYKCPHCGKHLGRNGSDYCQYCGKATNK